MKKFATVISLAATVAVNLPEQGFAYRCSQPAGSVRIAAVGDILIHKALYQRAVTQSDGFLSLFKAIVPALKDADITFGNLEGPLAAGLSFQGTVRPFSMNDKFEYDGRVYSGTNFIFNFHPSLAIDLKNSGFDIVATANNHSMDRKSRGVDLTIQALNEAGLPFHGTKSSAGGSFAPRMLNVKGKKIAFIACAENTNGIPDPQGQVLPCHRTTPLVASTSRRSDVDAVVVAPHWGVEYKLKPSSFQRRLAKEWAEAGATLVLGNHPHVVQPMESIRTRDGRQVLVSYSLGNFIAGQGGSARDPMALHKSSSAILYIDLVSEGGSLVAKQFSYRPIYRRGLPTVDLQYADNHSGVLSILRQQLGPATCQQVN